MKIILSGITTLGIELCARLQDEGHEVILIERELPRIRYSLDTKDIRVIRGNCAAISALQEAGIMEANILIAATESDEKNLLSCITAHDLNSEIRTIARIRTPDYSETTGLYYDKFGLSMTIDPELYLPVIQKLRTIEGSEIVVEGVEKSWIEGYETPVTKLMRDQYHYSVENVPDLDALASERIVKISLHHPNVEEATKDLFRSHRLEKLSMTISGAAWLDIISPEAGKGEAFALLQEYLGVGIEETVYFGDNLNDLSAFHEAGVAATVANARQEMHDAADIVASSFSDLGVLRQLRHILDLEKRFKAEGNI
jgi:hydroxymethylpyrimidine pyrophosphatase-like HAD family hydrolase